MFNVRRLTCTVIYFGNRLIRVSTCSDLRLVQYAVRNERESKLHVRDGSGRVSGSNCNPSRTRCSRFLSLSVHAVLRAVNCLSERCSVQVVVVWWPTQTTPALRVESTLRLVDSYSRAVRSFKFDAHAHVSFIHTLY